MTHRTGVEIEQADQHLADDARADRTKTIAPLTHIGFAKNADSGAGCCIRHGLTKDQTGSHTVTPYNASDKGEATDAARVAPAELLR